MNVWIRVSSKLNIETDGDGESATSAEIKAVLEVTVYAAKTNAKEAQQDVGGIIFEVDASCLADVESRFGKEVFLSSGTDYEGNQPTSAYITVCYDGLDGTIDPQSEIAEFGPTALTWFEELEKETGFSLHQ